MKNWLDKNEYPFEHHYIEIDGRKLHYVDEGSGPAILFVHGTPSWSFDFRKVIKNVRCDYRCIAPDHLGFGLSGKDALIDYSCGAHVSRLESLIAALGIRSFHLVVHDFGGPIGLQVAQNAPSMIESITILNSWMWSTEGEPSYERLKKMLKSPLLPFLYKYLNFSARFILPASFGEKKIRRSILSHYTRPFASVSERSGTLAFARSLLHEQYWFGSLWQNRNKIAGKPACLIWGMQDKIIDPSGLDRFAGVFEDCEINKIETAGHFPQEEAGDEVAAILKKFLYGLEK